MTDILATGMAWLDTQRNAYMTGVVTYKRGARSVTLPATKGRSVAEAESVQEVGVVQRVESVDWLIRTEDLDFGDGPTLPHRGDRVEDADGYVYEVMPFGLLGDTHWQWASEPARITYRIHSKLVDKP